MISSLWYKELTLILELFLVINCLNAISNLQHFCNTTSSPNICLKTFVKYIRKWFGSHHYSSFKATNYINLSACFRLANPCSVLENNHCEYMLEVCFTEVHEQSQDKLCWYRGKIIAVIMKSKGILIYWLLLIMFVYSSRILVTTIFQSSFAKSEIIQV